MSAPENFARWMSSHNHHDKKSGAVYRYHPRSDAHSVALCLFILQDLLDRCEMFKNRGVDSNLAYGINVKHTWPNDKTKTIDLAIGLSSAYSSRPTGLLGKILASAGPVDLPRSVRFDEVRLSCEAKAVMTEHSKSRPRVFDELSSSHEIVHQGSQKAIAAGITVVNIAQRFASPLRQIPGSSLDYYTHQQPRAAMLMVNHLRGLPIRESVRDVGFDAYSTIVIECDNQSACTLWTSPPAPQPGEYDHYDTFIDRVAQFYSERFS